MEPERLVGRQHTEPESPGAVTHEPPGFDRGSGGGDLRVRDGQQHEFVSMAVEAPTERAVDLRQDSRDGAPEATSANQRKTAGQRDSLSVRM
jgi:hypothetical protein